MKQTYSLSREQTSLVEARFSDLEAAVRHVGRMHWRLMFLGVLFGLVITGILPPAAMHAILVTVLQNLDSLFGGGGPPQLPAIA